MTISSDSVKNEYSTNSQGTDSELPITFTYFDNSEIEVYLKADVNVDSEVKWALTTNYTITGSPGASPKVKLVTDPAEGGRIIIRRKTPYTQLVDYAAGDAFPADSHETALDRVVALAQQLKEILERSLAYPNTYVNATGRSLTLPEPENNAIVKWNTDATAMVNDTDLAVSAYKIMADSAADTHPGYLDDKLLVTDSTGILKSTTGGTANQNVTISGIDATTSVKGVASFSSTQFSTSSGAVSIKSGAVIDQVKLTGALTADSTTVKDEDNMSSDSATHLATQQSIKAYVDAVTTSLGLQDLDFSGDSGGAQSVDLDTEALKIEGGTGIDTVSSDADGSTPKISVAIDSTVTTLTGTQTLQNKRLTSPKLNEDVAITATATEVNILDGVTATTSELNIMDGVTATTSELNIMDGVTATASELNILDGVTATASELNIMDGVTASTSELNILDGVTATASEINLLDGVSGLVQADLTKLAAVDASASELNIMDGVTASTSELNILDGVTSTASELNILDGVTASTSELNIMDGVTATTSELNIMDGVTASTSELNIMDGVTATTAELNLLDGSTAGTNVAGKALVVDSDKKINELFQDKAIFNSQGSDPGTTPDSNDVYLYAKANKLYTKDSGGNVAEVGAGAGGGTSAVGDIDTVFTLQAKDESSASDASGDDAVFRGAAASVTSAPTLDTTAGKLINTTKVFKYASGSGSTNDWWLHSKAVPQGYQNRNMVLQLQYYMEETSGDNLTNAFRFVARDATNGKVTQLNGAVSSSNTITLDAFADGDYTVGDRVTFKDTGGAIHFRYITSVTHGSEQLTISGATVSIADDAYFVSGILTDELDYLDNFKPTTAGQDGAKLYRKQMLIPSNCDTLEFGFHYLGSQTDQFLYYDDIALSANQFLQASSQGQTESYFVPYQNNFWDNDTHPITFDESLVEAGPDTPALANSKLVTIADLTGPGSVGTVSGIKAKENITLNFTISGDGTASGELHILNSSEEIIGFQGPVAGTVSFNESTCSINLAKDDYIWAKLKHKNGRYGTMTLTATPLVNDVVLLNSQDEIFTDWIDGGEIVLTGTNGSPTKPNGNTKDKIWYRRNGPNYQFRIEYAQANISSPAASGSSTDYLVTLPAGLSFDLAKVSTYTTAEGYGVWNTGGVGLGSASGSWSDQSATGFIVPYSATQFRVFLSRHGDDGVWGSAMFPLAGYATFALTADFEAPIAGCSATFNPVLSMPLVDFSEYENTYSAVISGTSISTTSADFIESISQGGTDSGQWTITYKSGFFSVAPAVQVTVDSTTSHGRIGQVVSHSSSNCVISSVNQSSGAQTANDVHNMMLTVVRQGTDYRKPPSGPTAAVIKPAVLFLTDQRSSGTLGGGASSSGSNWYPRTLNTVSGDSWFLNSLSSNTFQLQPGHYTIFAQAHFMNTNLTRIKLYDTSNSKDVVIGMSSYISASAGTGPFASLNGSFVITANTNFELHYRVSNTNSTNDLGQNDSFGVNEIYANVRIEKLK